jgi:hypothetical protein
MPHQFGIALRLLMRISWNVSSRSLHLYVSVVLTTSIFTHLSFWKLNTVQVRRQIFDATFFIHVFLESKFCPSLLDNVSLRLRLVILGTSASVSQHAKKKKNALPLDVQQLRTWYTVILIQAYLVRKLGIWNRFYATSLSFIGFLCCLCIV